MRGEPQAAPAIRGALRVLVPVIVLGELRAGFRAGRREHENETELREFLSQPAVSVQDVDDAAALIYADLVAALHAAGTPIPTNDIWIAAVAVRDGATVLTYDAHFASIRRASVKVIPLPPTK